jgi:Zn-dependent M28 family amino/carboxypeptidase
LKGEEQDFYGSRCHVNHLDENETVVFMLNIDMIGFLDTVIIESEAPYKIFYEQFRKAVENNGQTPDICLRPVSSHLQ